MARLVAQTQAVREHLEPLRGATVIDVDVADVGLDEPAPLLIMRLADGNMVAVMVYSDPEGNGPGHLELQRIDAMARAEDIKDD